MVDEMEWSGSLMQSVARLLEGRMDCKLRELRVVLFRVKTTSAIFPSL
jgi:hypothetical protein